MILVLLAAALGFYFFSRRAYPTESNLTCEILLDGEVVITTGLSENQVFSLDRLPNVVFEIKDGAAAFISSDCPDKVCVHSGYQHMPGQMAVCLPNRVALRITGGSDAPDTVI